MMIMTVMVAVAVTVMMIGVVAVMMIVVVAVTVMMIVVVIEARMQPERQPLAEGCALCRLHYGQVVQIISISSNCADYTMVKFYL